LGEYGIHIGRCLVRWCPNGVLCRMCVSHFVRVSDKAAHVVCVFETLVF